MSSAIHFDKAWQREEYHATKPTEDETPEQRVWRMARERRKMKRLDELDRMVEEVLNERSKESHGEE